MLRRTESVARKDEPAHENDNGIFVVRTGAPRAEPAPQAEPQPTAPTYPQVDRRKSERRGMDQLRAEALQTLITRVEDRNFGGLRDRMRVVRGLPMSRILLLVVALAAGGVAAFLAMHREDPVAPAPEVTETVVAAPTAQVLVAKSEIHAGQRLSPAAVQWVAWPESALRPELVTATAEPDAITDMSGSVARSDFVAGEPILAQKLAPAGTGLLAAMLDSGMRAVSVAVDSSTASGGFILPDDHVDVVLSRSGNGVQQAETILRDVRVLAINDRLSPSGADAAPAEGNTGAGGAQGFTGNATATLALTPAAAQVITNAAQMGRLTLLLRASTDGTPARAAGDDAANAAIRLTSPFWTGGVGGGVK